MVSEFVSLEEETRTDKVSFLCTACGKCCNSPPLMSVSELFYHETLFVGCLALRRVNRHRSGDALMAGNTSHPLSEEDARLLEDLSEAQLFKVCPADNHYISIMTQGMDYETLNRCPALNDNQGCSIHDNRKPTVCSMVPFDSSYPDSMQNIVLISRRFDENCIAIGQPEGYQPVVANRKVVNQQFRENLQKRRNDLCWEKQLWGNAVFQSLRKELFYDPAQAAKIPAGNETLLLSIIPVLQVLASISERTRTRCLRYVDNQICLLDGKISQAISRKSAADKQTTREFRLFKEHYLKFRQQLVEVKRFREMSNIDFEHQKLIDMAQNSIGA
jgi:Fe-S-cluster containining protein